MISQSLTTKLGLSRLCAVLFIGFCLTASGCDTQNASSSDAFSTSRYQKNTPPTFSPKELKPGGDTTVSFEPIASFEKPAANLPLEDRPNFHAGKALANQPWVKPPTVTTARDGLGPLYNARTCLMCHVKGGKGFIPDSSDIPLMGTLVRLSILGADTKKGVVPHPVYGDQIQGQSISLAHQLRNSQSKSGLQHDIKPEAYVHLNWKQKTFTYPDDSMTVLRFPEIDFRYLGYGPIGNDTLVGLRVAPAIHGMGLLELIPQKQILALEDKHDDNTDGISGKANWVWDVETQSTALGRFGLKANKPTLAMTVAGAFTNDVGITNPLFPNEPCTEHQVACQHGPTGNDDEGVELSQTLLDLVVNFNRNLAPTATRALTNKGSHQGRSLFYEARCNQCHVPTFTTGQSDEFPHLSNQIIWPYTDLLLHDLGPDLADDRPDFLASGSEWRTPPLWGVGLRAEVNGSLALLHDGRAKTVEEAILWHGGEATNSQQFFVNLSKPMRNQLIEFVESL